MSWAPAQHSKFLLYSSKRGLKKLLRSSQNVLLLAYGLDQHEICLTALLWAPAATERTQHCVCKQLMSECARTCAKHLRAFVPRQTIASTAPSARANLHTFRGSSNEDFVTRVELALAHAHFVIRSKTLTDKSLVMILRTSTKRTLNLSRKCQLK